jgi:hypothetical protein
MYKFLKEHKLLIKKLSEAGVVDPHWMRDIEMVEDFDSLKINCVMCKYTIIAEKYGLSERRVRERIAELKI